MKKLRIKLEACWRRIRRLGRRSSEWEAGTMGKGGVLQARRHRDGRVEIFAQRDYCEPLWVKTHRDHWHKFTPNAEVSDAKRSDH